jgi:hypothetical protein
MFCMKFILFMVIIIYIFTPVYACVVAPRSSVIHHAELINQTEAIVLAKAIGFDYVSQRGGVGYRYYFETFEVLKGELKKTFYLEFQRPPFYDFDEKFLEKVSTDKSLLSNDFKGHRNPVFWNNGGGRIGVAPNCGIYPFFIRPKKYLIFQNKPNKPFHFKGFEQIESQNDKWLLAVRKVIQNPSITSGFSQTPFEYLRGTKSVYYIKCSEEPDKREKSFQKLKHLYGKKYSLDDFFLRNRNSCSENYGLETHVIGSSRKEFLLIIYQEMDIEYSLSIPITNDLVDFTLISTEIEFKGNKRVPLTKVIEELKGTCFTCFLLYGTIFLLIFVSLFFFWKKIRKHRTTVS